MRPLGARLSVGSQRCVSKWLRMSNWLLMLATFGTGCGTNGEPRTGGQTNWLRACQADAECGNLKCLCGACTQTCDTDASCSALPGASCVPAAGTAATALCSGSAPSYPGLCLPECPSDGCASGTSCVAGVCQPALEPNANVNVDEGSQRQTLIGIGSSVAYINDELVQHPRKEALFDAMFSETGFSILRLRNRYGDDGADLASTQEIVAAASERLGQAPLLLLNSASPPASLKANGSAWCEGNPDSCTLVTLPDGSFDYAGLAGHWRVSLEAYAEAGIAPDYISIQNNPNWVPSTGAANEACRFLPNEGTELVSIGDETISVDYPGYTQALDAVSNEIAALAAPPAIVAPETTGVSEVPAYIAELDLANVDAIAYHAYGTDPNNLDLDAIVALSDLGEQTARPLFQSEMAGDALTTALLLHTSLVLEGAAVFIHNGFLGSASSLDLDDEVMIHLTDDDFVITDPYHVMRHYSSHFGAGWTRVVSESDSDDVLTSAWVSPDADQLCIVLTNASLNQQVVRIDAASDQTASRVIRTVLTGEERSAGHLLRECRTT